MATNNLAYIVLQRYQKVVSNADLQVAEWLLSQNQWPTPKLVAQMKTELLTNERPVLGPRQAIIYQRLIDAINNDFIDGEYVETL